MHKYRHLMPPACRFITWRYSWHLLLANRLFGHRDFWFIIGGVAAGAFVMLPISCRINWLLVRSKICQGLATTKTSPYLRMLALYGRPIIKFGTRCEYRWTFSSALKPDATELVGRWRQISLNANTHHVTTHALRGVSGIQRRPAWSSFLYAPLLMLSSFISPVCWKGTFPDPQLFPEGVFGVAFGTRYNQGIPVAW